MQLSSVKLNQTWLLAVGFVVMWNSGFIGAEYALPNTQPLSLLFWRYWALSIFLFIYLNLTGQFEWPNLKTVLISLLTGILAHGVWLGCVFYSLEYGVPAGIVALVVALQPMATGALSGLMTGERPGLLSWVGLSIGFSGVAIAVMNRMDFKDTGSIVAFLIPFGSVVAITVASLLRRRLVLQGNNHRLGMGLELFYQSLGVALAVTIPAVLFEGLAAQWTPVFVGAMLWLILGVSLVAYGMMWMLISRLDATKVASLFYFGPPVTMLMAWLAFGDKILISDLAGLAIVMVGVALTHMKK
jgi:drug/metabolite transporter (DMT)-like permease